MRVLVARLGERLHWVCAALALYYIGIFIFIAVQTLNYPFHLEWMEGQVIDVVQRVRSSLPVYAKPSLDYVAFAYTPYYYYVSAFVSLFTGVDFIAARLVSFLSALGTGGIIYSWLRREKCTAPVAVTGAGAYFATYILSGRWMDVSRVDSLFLFLVLSSLYVFYYYRDWQGSLCAAALMTAAFFTKQTASIAMAPAFVAMILLEPRHGLRTLSIWFSTIAAISVMAHFVTDGWFTFFVYQLSSGHTIQKQYLIAFWTKDLFPKVGFMMVIGALLLAHWLWTDWRKAIWFGAIAAGFFVCSYAARLNWGGYLNVLMPACAALGILTGLALKYVKEMNWPWLSLMLPLIVCAQFAHLFYNPYRYIPDEESLRTGNRFLEKLARVEGDIFMPEVQFVQTRVGKKSYTLGMAALDVIATDLGDKDYIKQDLIHDIRQAIERQQFGAVVPGGVVPVPGANKYYTFKEGLSYPREYVTLTKNFLKRGLMVPVVPKTGRLK